MNDQLNFDTVDILVSAIGAIAAFSMLSVPVDRATERVVVPLSRLLMVTVERLVLPTKLPNPNSSAVLRMVYLLIALVGTVFLGLPLLSIYFNITEFREPGVLNILFLSGVLFLWFATFIDRRFLKLRT